MPSMADWMAEGDRTVARRESESFLRGLSFALHPEALWVNPPIAQPTAELKTRQLVAAQRVGLRIPRTVMTNDMDVVRDFVDKAQGQVIYKGYRPAVWTRGSMTL